MIRVGSTVSFHDEDANRIKSGRVLKWNRDGSYVVDRGRGREKRFALCRASKLIRYIPKES